MQTDFHYYATYCAAFLAGYSHEESLDICYSAQFVDWCSRTYLSRLKAPLSAATTQLQLELMDAGTDPVGLQDITRIWASFHFLPRDLNAERKKCSKHYRNKYRLICGPNGDLVAKTIELAKGRSLQAAGVAMHIIADTWAHQYFAGTPSLVINNTNYHFYEILPDGERKIRFRHSASQPDDLDQGLYTCSLFQSSENSIMNLGHGRAGHLPDYSFMRYRYLPAWGDYEEIIKDNPSDYYHAFCQLIYAMQYLRGERSSFETGQYAWETAAPYEEKIRRILETRKADSCEEWAEFGESLSGQKIPDFDKSRYEQEYLQADTDKKDDTFLGKFILAALAQKSMVTNQIFLSGSMLAGFSVDFADKGFRGIKDFKRLVMQSEREKNNG
ncbi:MAG: hypothetical protein J5864_03910 [Oscillospiraceae bacterium]|nr:hypothetical protein [Oscillospiraceae bacterium]